MSNKIINIINEIFFSDPAKYISLLLNFYTHPCIHHQSNLQQEVKESVRILLAALIVGNVILFLINNLIFFSLHINLHELISVTRIGVSILFDNLLFGLAFSLLITLSFYIYYQHKPSVIKHLILSSFFYAVKLYAALAFPCFIIADLLYANFLEVGTITLHPHNILIWILLSSFFLITIFANWWFYINPIYKLAKHHKLKPRYLINKIEKIYTKLVKALAIVIKRTTLVGITSLVIMLSFTPKIIAKINFSWKQINKYELANEIKNSPFYQSRLKECKKINTQVHNAFLGN
ncbi:MAG: hypothetical protein PVI75_01865 [Gammaproteobacteria bacterium]|jgi:hypothetical protein